MATLFLFVIFQIPIVTAKNMNTVLALRFFTGLFGSPALATGVRHIPPILQFVPGTDS
jgi:DHA1 family multidrug resistance protein-like MFS transporter